MHEIFEWGLFAALVVLIVAVVKMVVVLDKIRKACEQTVTCTYKTAELTRAAHKMFFGGMLKTIPNQGKTKEKTDQTT